MSMPALHLPAPDLKLRETTEGYEVWDPIRRKFVRLFPEEWVRQHILEFLKLKGYPPAHTAVEYAIKINNLNKRCDVVVFKGLLPILIVECKAPHVPITQKTFDQIARYNLKLKVNLLMVTNGMQHYVAEMAPDMMTYHFLKELPDYKIHS
jgi:hypothetical protein